MRYRAVGRRDQREGWATGGIGGLKVRQWEVILREEKVAGWIGSERVKREILYFSNALRALG